MSASYGQFCPIAKASEIFATRWTPLIVREVMTGMHSFNDIHRGVPLISRAVLVARLRELEDHGVIERRPRGVSAVHAGDDVGIGGTRNPGRDEQTHCREKQGSNGHYSVASRASPHPQAGIDRFDRFHIAFAVFAFDSGSRCLRHAMPLPQLSEGL
jgi:hypothetical protein